jgi:hypothetical protein
MKKIIKETVVILAMPLLLILFIAKVLLTLYEIYAEKKQIKVNIHEI